MRAYFVEKLRFRARPANFFAIRADQLVLARGSAKFILQRYMATSLLLIHKPI